MTYEPAGIVLRRRARAEVLDLALRLVAAVHPRRAALLLALTVPVAVAACLAVEWASGLGLPFRWLVLVAVGWQVEGAFTLAYAAWLFGDDASAWEIGGRFVRRAPSLLLFFAASRAALLLSAAVFLIPLMFVWPRVLFVREALLVERQTLGRVLDRAMQLGGPLRSEVLLHGATSVGFQLVTVLAAEGLAGWVYPALLAEALPLGSLYGDGFSWFAAAGYWVALPAVAAMRLMAYVHLRIRLDGWDLQLRLRALGELREGRT